MLRLQICDKTGGADWRSSFDLQLVTFTQHCVYTWIENGSLNWYYCFRLHFLTCYEKKKQPNLYCLSVKSNQNNKLLFSKSCSNEYFVLSVGFNNTIFPPFCKSRTNEYVSGKTEAELCGFSPLVKMTICALLFPFLANHIFKCCTKHSVKVCTYLNLK